MPPTIAFDQGALPAGIVDRSRSDIALGGVVTVTAASVGGTAVFGLLARPTGSAAALGADTALTRVITPDVAGTYRVRIIDDGDGSSVIHTFTVRTARRGLAIQAWNERASELANDVDVDPGSWVGESETNEGGLANGWHPDGEELAREVEDMGTVVQARRTTAVILAGPGYVDVTLDVTDIETDPAILDHQLGVADDRILIGKTGLYNVWYSFSVVVDFNDIVSARVRVNDATVVPGSGCSIGGNSHNNDHPGYIGCMTAVQLTAGDFLTLQVQEDSAGDNEVQPDVKLSAWLL